ncbi:MAG: GYF domain-containing protein [Verrucomicrobiota bacterium]|nr:GYF domain-containing protein [Verrucomicrobiota bacterium]
MEYYFKTSDDNEFGPADEGQIRAWLEQGRMNQDSLVRTVDSEEWRPLYDYPELMALLAPSSSATPQSPTPPPQADVKHYEPHRGVLILTFGILGVACCFPFGIAAWVMGNNDMKQIKAGTMDPTGKGTTNAGKICGIIGTAIAILGCGFQLLPIVIEFSKM